MQAGAKPGPADRLEKKHLDELEAAYQFILLKSLDRFHKEMLRAQLPDKLHLIKEKLCGTTTTPFAYVTNLPFSSWNRDIERCRHCHTKTLKLRQFSNELCCELCGLLEPLDGVSFDYNEIYQYGDYKFVKKRRTNRCYNFKYYLDKHLRICAGQGCTVSDATVQSAKEAFDAMEHKMPKPISMPFVAFKILERFVQQEERFLLGYFLMQVPEGSVEKHNEKWENMLRQFDAQPQLSLNAYS